MFLVVLVRAIESNSGLEIYVTCCLDVLGSDLRV